MKLQDITLGCHGIPERCFKISGRSLPFCARCMGASIGQIGAAVNFIFSPLPSLFILPAGLASLLMDWTLQNQFKLYHSNISMLTKGVVGGYGVWVGIWEITGVIFNFTTQKI